ncbi:MAG TPA: hypothetical protein VKU41_05965 [Polyangiaceae bacterium]|nr:hypothetical protein [Polyangiaceae bacterium]
MRSARCVLVALLSIGLPACGGKILQDSIGGGPGAADASLDGAPNPYAAKCAGGPTPPTTLECTGLYTDIGKKTISPGIRPYSPAIPLWSDGAEKYRYIWLPPGTKIDATDPNNWKFPVGTKVWKEFDREGSRIETRLWQKTQTNFWVRATYRWSEDESSAMISAGGDFPLADGATYHIPTGDECDQCHRGRPDHLLGFEHVSLGLPQATGLTLPELVSENLISPVPAQTRLIIGDDGTGVAAPALAWIHVNCGVSCHNDNANSTGYGASQRLRLDPTMLDGRSSANFPTITTTVNQMADTPTWAGQTRIVPGDPTNSLLVKLITNRGTDNPVSNQMPPIASLLVDEPDTKAVIAWIAAMTPNKSSGP